MFDKNQLPDITEREKAFKLHTTYEELSDITFDLEEADCDPEALRLALTKEEEAKAAYEDGGVEVLLDGKGNAVRCAVSGAPILDVDEIEIVLRVAIGLPPRQSEEQLLPDMEDVA